LHLNFCTLFNKKYFTQGVTMIESLIDNCNDFSIYVFAFDDYTSQNLNNLNLSNVRVIDLHEFEDNRLLKVKDQRTLGEYCWTSTPIIIEYCFKKFKISNCTYLDADLYFFSNPRTLILEMNKKSVMITPHRYTKEYDKSSENGKYCVQFLTFLNNKEGLEVLNDWKEKCLSWCYARSEDGKFGDQKYLDHWNDQFSCIFESDNLGGGVAPWNIQQYKFSQIEKKIIGTVIIEKKDFELIYFHFHDLFIWKYFIRLSNYKLKSNHIRIIYFQYLKKFFKNLYRFKQHQNTEKIQAKDVLFGIFGIKNTYLKHILFFLW